METLHTWSQWGCAAVLTGKFMQYLRMILTQKCHLNFWKEMFRKLRAWPHVYLFPRWPLFLSPRRWVLAEPWTRKVIALAYSDLFLPTQILQFSFYFLSLPPSKIKQLTTHPVEVICCTSPRQTHYPVLLINTEISHNSMIVTSAGTYTLVRNIPKT